jgi:hypothetical protein
LEALPDVRRNLREHSRIWVGKKRKKHCAVCCEVKRGGPVEQRRENVKLGLAELVENLLRKRKTESVRSMITT